MERANWNASKLPLQDNSSDEGPLLFGRAVPSPSQREPRPELAMLYPGITLFGQDKDFRYIWVQDHDSYLTNEATIGKTDDDLFPPSEAAVLKALKKQSMDSGERVEAQISLHCGGAWQTFDMIIVPYYDVSGQPDGVDGVMMEITGQELARRERKSLSKRRTIQRQLLEQREQERLQIARDLHDGPLQDMIAIRYVVEGIGFTAGDEQQRESLKALSLSLQKQIDELRAFAGALRPPGLMKFGLATAVRSNIEELREKHPTLDISLETNLTTCPLSQGLRLALYRIYQEAMANIFKHARATQIAISFMIQNSQVLFEISDNGVGFTVPADIYDLVNARHLGLIGLRERAEAFGGTAEIESAPGKGTIVRVRAPVV